MKPRKASSRKLCTENTYEQKQTQGQEIVCNKYNERAMGEIDGGSEGDGKGLVRAENSTCRKCQIRRPFS